MLAGRGEWRMGQGLCLGFTKQESQSYARKACWANCSDSLSWIRMGLNLDIAKILGLPGHSKCPKCGKLFPNHYIECGNFNPTPGQLVLANYCPNCEYEFQEIFIVSLTKV